MSFISRFKLKQLLIIFAILISFPSFSNPFHSQPEQKQPPKVRTSNAAPPFLIEWQLELREKIGDLLSQIKEGENNKSFFLILLTGFIYGILHAAGPGHRKSVLFSIFLSRESKLWEPATAGILSAFLHGSSGILLILILKNITYRFLSLKLDTVSTYMETISFFLLLLFSIILIMVHLFHKKKKKEDNDNRRNIFLTIAITSIFPCPGAILILLLAFSFDILFVGVLTVIALSLGMGITITAIAYLGKFGRISFFNFFKSKEQLLAKINNVIELSGYCFLFLFSLWMCLPAIVDLFKS